MKGIGTNMNPVKNHYPVSAAALTMVIFTQTGIQAALGGILLIISFVFALIIKTVAVKNIPEVYGKGILGVSILSLNYAVFKMGFYWGGQTVDRGELVYNIIGVLILSYIFLDEGKFSLYTIKECGILYIVLLVLGVIREVLSFGTVFSIKLFEGGYYLTDQYQKPAMGLILGGLAIGGINYLIKRKNNNIHTGWVIYPMILMQSSLVISGGWGDKELLITVILPLLLYYSVGLKLKYSLTPIYLQKLPVEMISLGLVYLVIITTLL